MLSLSYDPGNMNIIQKTDAGDFRYDNTGNAGVHAISQLDNSTGLAEGLPKHTITYTDFDKTEKIQEGQKEILFTYGPGQARKKAAYKENSTLLYTRYYSGNYEKTVYATGDERKIYYISGGDGLAAMYVIENGISQVYYPHSDYLGNIERVTDASGNLVEEHSYDAWGNRRSPSTWEPITGTGSYLAYRGFTGHEHIDEFGLINMNGRIYDPTLGMFLSPDNHIQAPDMTHNFNRYAYALNNPMKYTDPDGEFIFTLATLIAAPFTGGASLAFLPEAIGADIGTWLGGTIANEGEMNPFKWDYSSGKTWGYMAGGAIVGASSGYIGGTVAAEGGSMANTMGIASASYINSVGTHMYTGGQTDVSISFGAASYNFSQGEWGYLGKSVNSTLENIGYGFGALANLSDVVSLINGGGQNIDVNSASTKEDWWGHSSITDENGKTLVSIGPDSPFQKSATLSETWQNSIKAADVGWKTYLGEKGTWSLKLNNVSTNAINKYTSGISRWDLLLNSCVGHTTRALWRAGVPTIYAIHPHMLNLQLFVRQMGIYSSPYLY